jgi:hypothetical protein
VRRVSICLAFLAFAAYGAAAQSMPPLSGTQTPAAGGVPPAPVGHRQPTPGDLPPAVQKEEQPNPLGNPQPQVQSQPQTQPQKPSRSASRTVQGRGGGGSPPVLQVGPSCEAAGRGAVVLGRNKEACLADETAAQDTLRQNWAKYAANDKIQCVGMAKTGGPASYVELLSCLEIMRDARQIQNADPLEGDNATAANTAPTSTPTSHRRRR